MDDWENAVISFAQFLKEFYDATMMLSETPTPMSNLVLSTWIPLQVEPATDPEL